MNRKEIVNSQDYKAIKAALKWWYSLSEEQEKGGGRGNERHQEQHHNCGWLMSRMSIMCSMMMPMAAM